MLQKTIKKAVTCSGIGLHGGQPVRLALRPAPENAGVTFAVKSPSGVRMFKAHPEAVQATGMATTIGLEGDPASRAATVEHLLAAVAGLEIDNLLIELEGGEAPILDGSAGPFVRLLRQAGLREQARPRQVWSLTAPFEFEHEGKYVRARPAARLTVDFAIEFPHPLIGRQRLRYVHSPRAFERELARARTFGFLREVEYLKARGLAKGGSLENAVVLDDAGVMNPDGLRWPDEFVRHKILDFMGDVSLFGAPIVAEYEIFASGHALNNGFLRALAARAGDLLEPLAWREPAAPAYARVAQVPAASRMPPPRQPKDPHSLHGRAGLLLGRSGRGGEIFQKKRAGEKFSLAFWRKAYIVPLLACE